MDFERCTCMDTAAILRSVEHRSWPVPPGPWVMTQIWHELLFAHWSIAVDVLQPLVPSVLPLDTFDGQCWIGIVPFHMTYVRPRGVPPVPGLSAFPELNVRTYVTLNGIPGVYFFSLDAGNAIAVALARKLAHLPYFKAQMSSKRVGEIIDYHSLRTHRGVPAAEMHASYRPVAPVVYAQPDSLEHWLTERYCLYTVVGQRVYRCDIHHQPWPLQVAEMDLMSNTMADAAGLHLSTDAPLFHYAQKLEVLIWPLRHVL
jgi:uncharacterized protein YqjF (DUF2071 family)